MSATARSAAAWSLDRSRCERGSSRSRWSIGGWDSLASRSSLLPLSDCTDIGKALLRQCHAIGDMARLMAVHIEREHRTRAVLLGPPDQPTERGPANLGTEKACLGTDDGIARFRDGEDIAHQFLAALRDRQRAAPQPVDEIDLLDRVDTQIAGQPELVDAAADIAVAVLKQIEKFLHSFRADAPGDLLIDRHRGRGDRRAHGVVAIPGLDASDNAVPPENILVGIGDHTCLQRDDRIRNLEGRARQHRLCGAILVAGDDQIILDLVADEGADRSIVGKPLGQILANLAALRRDMRKAARRQDARGSQETERMATIDQGSIRYSRETAATMLMASW